MEICGSGDGGLGILEKLEILIGRGTKRFGLLFTDGVGRYHCLPQPLLPFTFGLQQSMRLTSRLPFRSLPRRIYVPAPLRASE